MNNYYIYIYLDPRKSGKYCYNDICFTFEPFYIGKGKDKRIENINARNKYFKNKINKIKKLGIKPVVFKLFENLSEEQSFIIEKNLIKEIGRCDLSFGSLLNMTDGGEGSSGLVHSKETRYKIYKKVKKDFQKIKNEFERRKYILITKKEEYKNNKETKLKYICPEGHEGSISWNNFQRGQGCSIEGKKHINKNKNIIGEII